MKLLITGASGQLGRSLISVLDRHEVVACPKNELDVTDRHAVHSCIQLHRPEVVIHAAAFTNVDLSETCAEQAFHINAFGTRHVAEAAQAVGAKLVHISTDYVFDGLKNSAYEESDAAAPLNVYGATKLLSERFAVLYCSRVFILRTAWLYGGEGQGFVQAIYRQALQKKQMKVVTDSIGSPTYTVDLAKFIKVLIASDNYGLYHAVNEGSCSRYEWAKAICGLAGLHDAQITPVMSEEYVKPAARPKNSALACTTMTRYGYEPMRPWHEALHEYMKEFILREEERKEDG